MTTVETQPLSKMAQPQVAVVQPQPLAKSQLEILSPYLPLVFTLIGWFVVSRQHDRRERRKEICDLVRLLEQRVDDILELASEYYAMDGKNPKCHGVASKINSKMTAVSQLLSRLNTAGLKHRATSHFIAFKQSVTGSEIEFESISRTKKDPRDSVLSPATSAGFALIGKLEKTYFEMFPVRMTPIWKFWAS